MLNHSRLFLLFIMGLLFLPIVYAETATSFSILSMADIHFNPFAACKSGKMTCPLINELQQASAEQWPVILQKYDTLPQRYGHDTGYPLLALTLQKAKKAAEVNHVRFVLLLGDFLAHEYPHLYHQYAHDQSQAAYTAFVKKTIMFLSQQLAAAFPNRTVYAAVGNNDGYHGDYVLQPSGAFFRDTAQALALLQPHIKRNNFMSQFAVAGYYAVQDSQMPLLRILILNSVFFSYKAKGLNIKVAAEQQLHWLHEQLALAKINHEQVLIAMHIPPTIDFNLTQRLRLFTLFNLWRTSYQQQFQAEIQAYAQEIVGIITAHLHEDGSHVMTFADGEEIPHLATSAVSPIFGNQPEFNVYTFSLAHEKSVTNTLYSQEL